MTILMKREKSITICIQRLIWQFLNYYIREKDNSREKKEHVTKVDESVHVKNSEKNNNKIRIHKVKIK